MTKATKITMEVKFDSRYRVTMTPQELSKLTGFPVANLTDPAGIPDTTMEAIAEDVLSYVLSDFGYRGNQIKEIWDVSEMTMYEVERETS